MPVWVGYATTLIGLLPLLAVWWYPTVGTDRRFRLVAAGLAVSFVADVAGILGAGMVVSQTYPVLQAGLIAAALAPVPVASAVIAVLLVCSGASLAWRGAAGLDLLLHVTAWGSTAALARHYLTPGPLRATLVWGFAVLALAWVGFRWEPTFLAWGVMQGVRLAMALGFAWAVREAARAE